ncbi:MAG: hypothetical protein H0X66_08355 [Verrucomicrobia bacterium]|nr:hypothetical protein [Verrucomicrobiota bacterium]
MSFLLALTPSAQAQTKSDAEALKKARDAEEAAKKEAVKRAKEAEKAAKKARDQEEAARKAERLAAEQKARARDEALRRARAAAAAAKTSESKQAGKITAGAEEAARKAQLAEQEAHKVSAVESDKRTKSVEEARKSAEIAREAAKNAGVQEAARKAKEAEEAAKHEASVRKAQEKEVAQRARETAEQLRKLNLQQEAERKTKEAELARKTKAENEAVKKAQAEEAVRQARAEAEARKAKVAEEAASREAAKEVARLEKQEAAARAKSQEEAARKLKQANAPVRSTEPSQISSASNVSYEGETFRIVKVTREGSASVVAPEAGIPVPVKNNAAADAKAKAAAEAELARQAKLAESARRAQEEEARRFRAETARRAAEAEAAANRIAALEAALVEKEKAAARLQSEYQPKQTGTLAAGRGVKTSMLAPPQPEPMPAPAPLAPREEYSLEERNAANQLRAKREALRDPAPVYVAAPVASISSPSRSGSSQARYYEELWEKELATRAGSSKQVEPTYAGSPDRRTQARYYEELWRKEQEGKAAKAATQTARSINADDEAVSRAQRVAEQKRIKEQEIARKAAQAESIKQQKLQAEALAQSRKPVVAAPQSTSAAKEAELRAEKARLSASLEASRKAPEAETFRPVQFEASKAAEQEARKRAEEDVRKARAQEDAARKTLEQAAAKKAKEERAAMARAEEDAAKKARAEEVAARAAEKEAIQRSREQRSTATAPAVQLQAEPAEKESFWARLRSGGEKSKTPAPDVSALLSDEERSAQDRALEALRQKQAELDAQEAQIKSGIASPSVSTPVFQPQATPAPQTIVVAPASSAEEAAKEARALAASNAELQSLRKKLANVSAEHDKVKTEIETAQKELSAPGAAKSVGKKFEVIVDNNDARLVGTWAEGKTGGFYGKDYAFKGKGTGANYADFTPNFSAAGTYEIFEWHVAGANRAADAPYIVNYDGGSQVVSVNQQLNGGKWNSIGTFAFAAGQSGSVRITDGIGLQGQMVMADAIRFVLVGGGGETAQVDNSARERAIEALRIKQDALSSEETRLKSQVQAAQKRIATLTQASEQRTTTVSTLPTQPVPSTTAIVTPAQSEEDIQGRAQEALRRQEAELNAAAALAPKPTSKKLLSVKNSPEPVVQEPTRPLTGKEQKLSDLLRRYKADEITPRDYHQERAKILAEP